MQTHSLFKKGLAVGSILLFIGTSSSTSASTIKNDIKSSIAQTFLTRYDYTPKNPIPQAYTNTQLGYSVINKWINPLQDRNVSLSHQYKSRMNDVPQITYNNHTLYVGGTGPGNYSTIQPAIFAASNGDTVYVYDGSYLEWPLLAVNKSIRLQGEDPAKTILNGRGHIETGRPVVWVYGNYVTISGFTIQRNSPTSSPFFAADDCGIEIEQNVTHTTISHNIFTKSDNGIFTMNSGANTISSNIFQGDIAQGLDLRETTNNIIDNNTFIDEGVYFAGFNNSIFSKNSFVNAGVSLTESTNNTFLNNTINEKPLVVLENQENTHIYDAGEVVLISCKNITVTNITMGCTILINCKNISIMNTTIVGTGIGIWLQHSNACTLIGNSIIHESGVLLEYSDNNTIRDNTISNSSVGILLGASNNNIVRSNNLIHNTDMSILVSMAEGNLIDSDIFDNNARRSLNLGFMLTSGAMNNTISNNCLINDTLFLNGAGKNKIANNSVNGKPLVFLEETSNVLIDTPAGEIILLGCSNIGIRNQTDIDIFLFSSSTCTISNVSFRPTLVYELYCSYSDYVSVSKCNFSQGGSESAIYLEDSNNTQVSNCSFSQGGYGIIAFLCSDCVYTNNVFSGYSLCCLLISGGAYNTVRLNDCRGNGGKYASYFGGFVISASPFSSIVENNFIDNTKGYAFNFRCKNDIFNGNYWDRPRVLPKIIFGRRIFGVIPSFTFDWHPARQPYIIPLVI